MAVQEPLTSAEDFKRWLWQQIKTNEAVRSSLKYVRPCGCDSQTCKAGIMYRAGEWLRANT